MKKLTQSLLLGSIIAIGMTSAGVAFAEHGKGAGCSHDKHMKMGRGDFDGERRLNRMTKKLDLSDEQRQQVKAIFDASQAERQALHENMQQNRETLRNLMASDNPVEADIRAIAETQGQLKADMIMMKTQTKLAIHAVLTDEQKAKMQSMRDKHQGRKSL